VNPPPHKIEDEGGLPGDGVACEIRQAEGASLRLQEGGQGLSDLPAVQGSRPFLSQGAQRLRQGRTPQHIASHEKLAPGRIEVLSRRVQPCGALQVLGEGGCDHETLRRKPDGRLQGPGQGDRAVALKGRLRTGSEETRREGTGGIGAHDHESPTHSE